MSAQAYSQLSSSLQAICTEAGLMALRERRMKVTNEDFKKSKENVLYKKQEGTPEGLYLWSCKTDSSSRGRVFIYFVHVCLIPHPLVTVMC